MAALRSATLRLAAAASAPQSAPPPRAVMAHQPHPAAPAPAAGAVQQQPQPPLCLADAIEAVLQARQARAGGVPLPASPIVGVEGARASAPATPPSPAAIPSEFEARLAGGGDSEVYLSVLVVDQDGCDRDVLEVWRFRHRAGRSARGPSSHAAPPPRRPHAIGGMTGVAAVVGRSEGARDQPPGSAAAGTTTSKQQQQQQQRASDPVLLLALRSFLYFSRLNYWLIQSEGRLHDFLALRWSSSPPTDPNATLGFRWSEEGAFCGDADALRSVRQMDFEPTEGRDGEISISVLARQPVPDVIAPFLPASQTLKVTPKKEARQRSPASAKHPSPRPKLARITSFGQLATPPEPAAPQFQAPGSPMPMRADEGLKRSPHALSNPIAIPGRRAPRARPMLTAQRSSNLRTGIVATAPGLAVSAIPSDSVRPRRRRLDYSPGCASAPAPSHSLPARSPILSPVERRPGRTSPGNRNLLGTFEESLLSGRLPNATSSVVQGFEAVLGACGSGRQRVCPSHVKLPLPAAFYQMADEATPTPYVGIIDLDEGLSDRRPKGMYRLPVKGVVQVVIKNPEKTGIKVFIVPYDFTDMPFRTKTFLRQRTFVERAAPASAGVAGAPSSHLGPLLSPPAATGLGEGARQRTILQYAAHLQFVRCKKGKVYLYKDIRVVFSHRAPDGNQTVKTITEGPTPTYSAWHITKRASDRPAAPRYRDVCNELGDSNNNNSNSGGGNKSNKARSKGKAKHQPRPTLDVQFPLQPPAPLSPSVSLSSPGKASRARRPTLDLDLTDLHLEGA